MEEVGGFWQEQHRGKDEESELNQGWGREQKLNKKQSEARDTGGKPANQIRQQSGRSWYRGNYRAWICISAIASGKIRFTAEPFQGPTGESE